MTVVTIKSEVVQTKFFSYLIIKKKKIISLPMFLIDLF